MVSPTPLPTVATTTTTAAATATASTSDGDSHRNEQDHTHTHDHDDHIRHVHVYVTTIPTIQRYLRSAPRPCDWERHANVLINNVAKGSKRRLRKLILQTLQGLRNNIQRQGLRQQQQQKQEKMDDDDNNNNNNHEKEEDETTDSANVDSKMEEEEDEDNNNNNNNTNNNNNNNSNMNVSTLAEATTPTPTTTTRLQRRRSGPGRISNAEYAISFYEYLLDSITKNKHAKESNDDDNDDDDNQSASSSSSSSTIESSSSLFLNQHDDECDICGKVGELLCCHTCSLVFHLSCVYLSKLPVGDWRCPYCLVGDNGNDIAIDDDNNHMKKEEEDNDNHHKDNSSSSKKKKKTKKNRNNTASARNQKGTNKVWKQASDLVRRLELAKKQHQQQKEKTQQQQVMPQNEEVVTSNKPAKLSKEKGNSNTKQERGCNEPRTTSSSTTETKVSKTMGTTTTTTSMTAAVKKSTSPAASPSGRSQRARRQPTLYNPQDGPDSKWKSDVVVKATVKAEKLPTSLTSATARIDDKDCHIKKDDEDDHDKADADNADDQDKENDVRCEFCQDDKRIPICVFCGCRTCLSKHAQEKQISCHQCSDTYHTFCVQPALSSSARNTTKRKWVCPSCKKSAGMNKGTLSTTTTTSHQVSTRRSFSSIASSNTKSSVPSITQTRSTSGISVPKKYISTPSKTSTSSGTGSESEGRKKSSPSSSPIKRSRGRPPKQHSGTVVPASSSINHNVSTPSPTKRPRGRPPKLTPMKGTTGPTPDITDVPSAKRPRGRPPKNKSIVSPSSTTTLSTASSSRKRTEPSNNVTNSAHTDANNYNNNNNDDEKTLKVEGALSSTNESIKKKARITETEDSTTSASASASTSVQDESEPVKISRSGRVVKRSSFHDEVEEGEQHLRGTRKVEEEKASIESGTKKEENLAFAKSKGRTEVTSTDLPSVKKQLTAQKANEGIEEMPDQRKDDDAAEEVTRPLRTKVIHPPNTTGTIRPAIAARQQVVSMKAPQTSPTQTTGSMPVKSISAVSPKSSTISTGTSTSRKVGAKKAILPADIQSASLPAANVSSKPSVDAATTKSSLPSKPVTSTMARAMLPQSKKVDETTSTTSATASSASPSVPKSTPSIPSTSKTTTGRKAGPPYELKVDVRELVEAAIANIPTVDKDEAKPTNDKGPAKVPRRKPGARECMQISRRFGNRVIPKKFMDTLLDYCTRGKVEHLIRMRERLDEHARYLESQLAGLETLVREKGEIKAVVPPLPERAITDAFTSPVTTPRSTSPVMPSKGATQQHVQNNKVPTNAQVPKISAPAQVSVLPSQTSTSSKPLSAASHVIPSSSSSTTTVASKVALPATRKP